MNFYWLEIGLYLRLIIKNVFDVLISNFSIKMQEVFQEFILLPFLSSFFIRFSTMAERKLSSTFLSCFLLLTSVSSFCSLHFVPSVFLTFSLLFSSLSSFCSPHFLLPAFLTFIPLLLSLYSFCFLTFFLLYKFIYQSRKQYFFLFSQFSTYCRQYVHTNCRSLDKQVIYLLYRQKTNTKFMLQQQTKNLDCTVSDRNGGMSENTCMCSNKQVILFH